MRGFSPKLAAIVAAGLAARLLYALLVARRTPFLGDAREFQEIARNLLDGVGYSVTDPGQRALRATANKPPLYPLLLVPVQAISRGYASQHVLDCLLGGGTIAAAGVLGRRVAGEGVGLLAAAIAALYPVLVLTDASLRSESLYAFLVALTLIAAYAAWDRPTGLRAAVLGAAIGATALTRQEALFFLPLLAAPVALRASRGVRLARGLLACAGCVLVIAPWAIRNAIVFDTPVLVSTNDATVIEGANCRLTYHGQALGGWAGRCVHYGRGDEAQQADRQRRRGLDYAGDHAARLPVVVAVRVLRTWGFYRPRLQWKEEAFFEGRDVGWQEAGTIVYFALLPLAIAGAMILRRRGQPIWILVSPAIVVTVASAIGYGVIRFRVAAEIPLVVLAATAVTAAATRGRRAAPRGSPSADPP